MEIISNKESPSGKGKDVVQLQNLEEPPLDIEQNGCLNCNRICFSGMKEAQGCATLGTVRGTIIMSNIFLSSSLIFLANVAAGCTGGGKECDNRVYGMRPSSLITNIAVISGIMAALLMPIIGAIIDYTPHRRMVGIVSAVIITAIQWVQIGTVQPTWFPMAILQAIGGFLYQVQVLATYSYYPEIGRIIGDDTMTSYTARFVMLQFSSQSIFLIIVVAFDKGLGLSDVTTAQVSQAINTALIVVGFIFAWMRLPSVLALHELGPGKFLFTAGFIEMWRTTKGINKHYGKGLRWFLLGSMFASAGANAFTTVAVTYMNELLKMDSTELGIAFLLALVTSIPGSKIGSIVSRKTNPVISWKILLVYFSLVTVAGAIVLSGPERLYFIYLFAALWGTCLGWFYPTSALIFSLSLPKGQESELTGFFIYSTQIIVWLPPLVFTLINEAGINMRWGLVSLVIFFVIALFFLQLMAPWSEVRDSALANNIILGFRSDHGDENDESDARKNHA